MRINLPNQITIGRLVLAIVFFALLTWYDHASPNTRLLDGCLVIFVVAALTDILDGYLARRQNQVTSLGRVLDPFVDKVLVCGAFVLFAGPAFADPETRVAVTAVAPWMVVLIIGRELLVSSLRGFTESQGQAYAASKSGKAKMIVQSITVPVLLLMVAHPQLLGEAASDWIKSGVVWITVVVTVLSMSSYLLRSKHILQEATRGGGS